MERVDVPLREMSEVEDEVMAILDRRRDEIDRGFLDGNHWFLALVAEARSAISRSRIASERRSRGS